MASAVLGFNPYKHFPETDDDRQKIEYALWMGWELTVDAKTGEVWIGDREEKIAQLDWRGKGKELWDIC